MLNALNTVSHEKRTVAHQTASLIIDLVSKGFYYTIKRWKKKNFRVERDSEKMETD